MPKRPPNLIAPPVYRPDPTGAALRKSPPVYRPEKTIQPQVSQTTKAFSPPVPKLPAIPAAVNHGGAPPVYRPNQSAPALQPLGQRLTGGAPPVYRPSKPQMATVQRQLLRSSIQPSVQVRHVPAVATRPSGLRQGVVQRSSTSAPTTTPTYVLAAVETSRKTNFACGGFDVRRKFTVTPAPSSGGIIIQKITRTFNYLSTYEGSAGSIVLVPGALPDTVNKNANYSGWTQYWEVFKVPAGSTDSEDQDSFSLTSMASLRKRSNSETRELKEAIEATGVASSRARVIANSHYAYQTKGEFTQTGAAKFYATTTIPASCKEDKKSPAAGLPVSKTDPTGALTAASNELTFTLTATWDSAVKGTKTWGEPTLS